jgi:hypothetical protein
MFTYQNLTLYTIPKVIVIQKQLPITHTTMSVNQSQPSHIPAPVVTQDTVADRSSLAKAANNASKHEDGKTNGHDKNESDNTSGAAVIDRSNQEGNDEEKLEEDDEMQDNEGYDGVAGTLYSDDEEEDDYGQDDEDDIEVDEHGQPIPLAPHSPPKLNKKGTRTMPGTTVTEADPLLSLKDKMKAASMSLRAMVPNNMRTQGENESVDPATTEEEGDGDWENVTDRNKNTKRFTESPVTAGDQLLIIKGHNDIEVANMERLTCIWMTILQQHLGSLDLIVRAVTLTEKDTKISAVSAKKRWARAGNTTKNPDIHVKVFAVHIGFAGCTVRISNDDEKMLIELLDDILRRKLHHHITSESKWPPHLETELAPVKSMKPVPIAVIYGMNPTSHGADSSTCNEISRILFKAYHKTLTGGSRRPTFFAWQQGYGVKSAHFQGLLRYHVYAADPSLRDSFHQALKTQDHKVIKFTFGGLTCAPRMIPKKPTDVTALKNLLIEYVDIVQKAWKPFLATGMATGLPQEEISLMVRASPLIATISYKTSLLRDTASAMIYVTDSFATIADVFGELAESSLTTDTNISNPKSSRAAGTAASPIVAGRAIGAKVAPHHHSPNRQAPRDDIPRGHGHTGSPRGPHHGRAFGSRKQRVGCVKAAQPDPK